VILLNELTQWSDQSVFKSFCLDRLAVGVPAESIAQDVSTYIQHIIPASQVLASCSQEEITARRKELLEEVKSSAPIISRDLLNCLNKIKNFTEKAERAFDNSDFEIEDFDAYRRSMELLLKALDVSFAQLGKLNDATKSQTTIVISFSLDDLKRLEASGAVKIIDAEIAGDLLGSEKVVA
jgi:hypothetical protein